MSDPRFRPCEANECHPDHRDCRVCDGTHVVIDERRQEANSGARAAIDAMDEKVRELVTATIHEYDRLSDHLAEERDRYFEQVTRLRLENKSVRGQLTETNRVLEQLRKQHRDAMKLLEVAKPDPELIAASEAH